MSSPTLDYSPSRQPSVRLGRIALGAAALALGILLSRAASILFAFVTHSGIATIYLYSALASSPSLAATVAACLLFFFALPPRRYRILRGTLLACAALNILLYAVHLGLVALALDAKSPVAKNLEALLVPLRVGGFFVTTALVAAYAAVLVLAAREFQRPALGILAACGLIPQFLASLAFFVFYAIRYRTPSSSDFIRYLSYASTAAQIWTFFLWLTIALFALILTARRRQPMIQ